MDPEWRFGYLGTLAIRAGVLMKRELGMSMAVVLAAAAMAAAAPGDEDVARRAGREDAPRLLKEAVRTGTADAGAFAAIADWILYEKEEKVAAGLAEALGALDPAATGLRGERWNETARAMFSLFATVLRQAEGNRRGGDASEREIAAVVSAAAPAVAAALREADPAATASFLAVLGGVKPVADDVVPLLAKAVRHPQREVRMGAATALGALGRSARIAIPALRAAADDPDAEVRAAAADALKRIEGK
jgi:HEAT repeat protein